MYTNSFCTDKRQYIRFCLILVYSAITSREDVLQFDLCITYPDKDKESDVFNSSSDLDDLVLHRISSGGLWWNSYMLEVGME